MPHNHSYSTEYALKACKENNLLWFNTYLLPIYNSIPESQHKKYFEMALGHRAQSIIMAYLNHPVFIQNNLESLATDCYGLILNFSSHAQSQNISIIKLFNHLPWSEDQAESFLLFIGDDFRSTSNKNDLSLLKCLLTFDSIKQSPILISHALWQCKHFDSLRVLLPVFDDSLQRSVSEKQQKKIARYIELAYLQAFQNADRDCVEILFDYLSHEFQLKYAEHAFELDFLVACKLGNIKQVEIELAHRPIRNKRLLIGIQLALESLEINSIHSIIQCPIFIQDSAYWTNLMTILGNIATHVQKHGADLSDDQKEKRLMLFDQVFKKLDFDGIDAHPEAESIQLHLSRLITELAMLGDFEKIQQVLRHIRPTCEHMEYWIKPIEWLIENIESPNRPRDLSEDTAIIASILQVLNQFCNFNDYQDVFSDPKERQLNLELFQVYFSNVLRKTIESPHVQRTYPDLLNALVCFMRDKALPIEKIYQLYYLESAIFHDLDLRLKSNQGIPEYFNILSEVLFPTGLASLHSVSQVKMKVIDQLAILENGEKWCEQCLPAYNAERAARHKKIEPHPEHCTLSKNKKSECVIS